MGERRPAVDEDDDDQRQQQRHDGKHQRAEQSLDALVRPFRAVLGLEILFQLGFLTSWPSC